MSKPREMLQEYLEDLPGVKGVYFQPPSKTKMVYPCIRYSRSIPASRNADNMRYYDKNRYDLVVIDPNPDTKIPDYILNTFTYCSMGRPYTADNLNHYPMTIYF